MSSFELINATIFSHALSRRDRLKALTFHYNFITKRYKKESIAKLADKGIICWQKNQNSCDHSITQQISLQHEIEGCQSLLYRFQGIEIYLASFTFCPASIFGLNGGTMMFISRLQGTPGKHVEISKASKQLGELFPSLVLMSALEGLCITNGIDRIVGICNDNQIATGERNPANYDDFWASMDSLRIEKTGDFLISVPLNNKPIQCIKSKHRKRTLKKRSTRKEISLVTQLSSKELISSVKDIFTNGIVELNIGFPVKKKQERAFNNYLHSVGMSCLDLIFLVPGIEQFAGLFWFIFKAYYSFKRSSCNYSYVFKSHFFKLSSLRFTFFKPSPQSATPYS